MSRLDLLPQTPKLADAQARNASAATGAQDNAGSTKTSDFGSLLDDFAGKGQKGSADISHQGADILGVEADKASSKLDGVGADPLQALLPDVPLGDIATGMSALQAGSPAFSFLENIIPRILAQAANGAAADGEQGRAALASAYLSMPQQDGEDLGPVNPGLGSRLAVSVQNQETHFRPIIEGLNSAPAEQGAAVSNAQVDSAIERLAAGRHKGIEPKTQQSGAGAELAQVQDDLAIEEEIARRREAQAFAKTASSDRMPDHVETSKQSALSGAKTEAASLPSSTLQHIAKAIVDDARRSSETQRPSFQHTDLNRVATARASAGVLRVLDLQLKPAELGLVTIRMRLAGDSIEMEIQAQNEDTAELLRNDAEKLSNLLRGSGYRPDVINIQSTETASHDRAPFHRPQQGAQAQGQSFDQGAAAGHGSSSRQQGEHNERSGREAYQDRSEGPPSGGSATGGIYL